MFTILQIISVESIGFCVAIQNLKSGPRLKNLFEIHILDSDLSYYSKEILYLCLYRTYFHHFK